MDTESIRTFLVLARTRNYTRAADQLFVAQSTVTNRINELEKELGFMLFTRTNRSVELTVKGEQFMVYAEKMMELTENSLAEISSVRMYDHYLRIGCADSIYEAHLAERIREHRKTHPGDYLKISIGLSDHLLEQVQNDMLDVVFTYLPIKKNSLHCELYKQDQLVLVPNTSTAQGNMVYENQVAEADHKLYTATVNYRGDTGAAIHFSQIAGCVVITYRRNVPVTVVAYGLRELRVGSGIVVGIVRLKHTPHPIVREGV